MSPCHFHPLIFLVLSVPIRSNKAHTFSLCSGCVLFHVGLCSFFSSFLLVANCVCHCPVTLATVRKSGDLGERVKHRPQSPAMVSSMLCIPLCLVEAIITP